MCCIIIALDTSCWPLIDCGAMQMDSAEATLIIIMEIIIRKVWKFMTDRAFLEHFI